MAVAGRHLVALGTSAILARLLAPSDFGLVAMAATFTRFVELIRDLGTGPALVREDEPGESLLSSAFWLNLTFGATASALLATAAPVAGTLLREPRLAPVLQLLAVVPLCSSLSVVHTSVLTRALRFRRMAMLELSGVLAGGVVAIMLARQGYGAWSLAWQSITAAAMVTAGTWLATAWRPRLEFHWGAIRRILRFSLNLTGFNILDYLVHNADNLLIGRYLGARDLGFYDLAYRLMLGPLHYVSTAFSRPLLPLYSRMRSEPARFRAAFLRVTGAIALLAFPILFGLFGVAPWFIDAVLGPQWAQVAILLRVFAPLGALLAITAGIPHIYQVMGRTDLLLRWQAAAGAVTVVAFVIGLQWGVTGVALSYAIVSCALAYPTCRIPFRLVDLRTTSLLAEIARPLLAALAMLLAVLVAQRLLPSNNSGLATLAVLIPAGAVTYVAATWIINRQVALQLLLLARGAPSQPL